MHLSQSQNNNVTHICIVGNPACMNSEKRGVKSLPEPIMCGVDCLFPYHMTVPCVRTTPPPQTHLLPGWLPT
jgi:hypothetical protein